MANADLTFDKVLATFRDYLSKDEWVEVVKTSRGYAVIEWDDHLNSWVQIEHCPSPTALQKALFENMADYLEYSYTFGARELTAMEKMQIAEQQKALI